MKNSDRRAGMRVIAVAVVVASAGFFVASCGARGSADIDNILEIPPPVGFSRVELPSTGTAREVAAQPLPPGYSVHPTECSPIALVLNDEQLSAITTVSFQSSSTVITLLGFDSGSSDGFEQQERCKTVTISGPGGAGGFYVPTEVPAIEGADAVWGTHALLTEGDGKGTYDQYLFFAKVKEDYRLLVIVALNYKQKDLPSHVDPGLGIDVLQRAVVAVS